MSDHTHTGKPTGDPGGRAEAFDLLLAGLNVAAIKMAGEGLCGDCLLGSYLVALEMATGDFDGTLAAAERLLGRMLVEEAFK